VTPWGEDEEEITKKKRGRIYLKTLIGAADKEKEDKMEMDQERKNFRCKIFPFFPPFFTVLPSLWNLGCLSVNASVTQQSAPWGRRPTERCMKRRERGERSKQETTEM